MRVFGLLLSMVFGIIAAAPSYACDWVWSPKGSFDYLAEQPLIISADVGETRPAGFKDGDETRPVFETDLHVVKQWKGETVTELTVRYEDSAWSDCGFSFDGITRLIIAPASDPMSVWDGTFWISGDDRGTGVCDHLCRRGYTFREYEIWLDKRFPAE